MRRVRDRGHDGYRPVADEPLGEDRNGRPVFLADIWPSATEVASVVEEAVQSDMFRKSYGEVFDGDER